MGVLPGAVRDSVDDVPRLGSAPCNDPVGHVVAIDQSVIRPIHHLAWDYTAGILSIVEAPIISRAEAPSLLVSNVNSVSGQAYWNSLFYNRQLVWRQQDSFVFVPGEKKDWDDRGEDADQGNR
jgi:hypothetical protein